MKTAIIIFLTLVLNITAQEYTVKKIFGDVKVLKGSSEKWETLKINDKLSVEDLVLTEKRSSLQLRKNDQIFVIKDDIAIGLNYLKKISKNELILALTLDEIRNVPKLKRNGLSKNTAVYGSEINIKKNEEIKSNDLGFKRINGAKLLNESGFKESSIIVAREVFRNYPKTAENFEDRLFFADALNDLELYQEALSEYSRIEKLDLKEEQKNILEKRNEEISLKLLEEK